MIKIKKGYFQSTRKVVFEYTTPSGRKYENYIETHEACDGDRPYLNMPAISTLHLEDITEFIKAVRLATMIASGELEIKCGELEIE